MQMRLHLPSGAPNFVVLLRFLVLYYLSVCVCGQDLGSAHKVSNGIHENAVSGGALDEHRGRVAEILQAFEDDIYEPDFVGLDRDIIGRAPGDIPTSLTNNRPGNLNAQPGASNTSHWYFTPSDVQTGVSVYVSINVCLQPTFLDRQDIANPPQLSLFISNSDDNKTPGPNSMAHAFVQPLVQGSASVNVSTRSSVYIGVNAPNPRISGNGAWNYDVAASVDGFYHSFNNTAPGLYMIDSDPNAALLVTSSLTNYTQDIDAQRAVNDTVASGQPFSIFVANSNNSAINGLQHSYCALKQAASVISPDNTHIRRGISVNQTDHSPEQQFYIPGLNKTSTYYGFMARTGAGADSGPGTVGGGGTVFPRMNFTTKRDLNCAVVYNLTFCNSVEYAVPANPYTYPNIDDLKALYDNQAAALYQNFSYSLQQIPCNTTSESQYSLARNCDDCANAYKTWLCAVTIPRCEDFLTQSRVRIPKGPADAVDSDDDFNNDVSGNPKQKRSYLMPRNLAQPPISGMEPPAGYASFQNSEQMAWLATNSSRNNATIAGLIRPGPFHEVLPCEELCYDIVRSCPAKLGFSCPQPGSNMMRASYGQRGQASDGSSTCNAPGVLYYQGAAGKLDLGSVWKTSGPLLVVVVLWVWI